VSEERVWCEHWRFAGATWQYVPENGLCGTYDFDHDSKGAARFRFCFYCGKPRPSLEKLRLAPALYREFESTAWKTSESLFGSMEEAQACLGRGFMGIRRQVHWPCVFDKDGFVAAPKE
jgi:hypothetical protein